MSEPLKITKLDHPAPATMAITPMAMLSQAMERGLSVDILERLMTLNERWEQGQAKKAFYEAKAAFKAEVPDIIRDKDNKQYGSTYASIGNVVNTVNKALSKHGLDAQWDIDQPDKISVTCILTHTMGYSERVKMTAPADVSGQKNPIQQIKSTTTYLRLATFEAVTGIATKEGSKDDDGNGAGDGSISEEQADELLALAEAVGASKQAFCQYLKVESFADIPAKQFIRAKAALEAKRKKAMAE